MNNTKVIDEKFKKGVPYWPAFEKFADNWFVRISWGVFYFLFYWQFATHWWMYLLLPIHFLMGPIQGAVVNWCGHKYGYSNFDNGDHSKNTSPWGVLLMGEVFQNNHHFQKNNANFAARIITWPPVSRARLWSICAAPQLRQGRDSDMF